MSNFVEMDFDEWFDTYKPIPNNIDTNASFDGHMFETYGDEVEFVKKADPAYIWMYGLFRLKFLCRGFSVKTAMQN